MWRFALLGHTALVLGAGLNPRQEKNYNITSTVASLNSYDAQSQSVVSVPLSSSSTSDDAANARKPAPTSATLTPKSSPSAAQEYDASSLPKSPAVRTTTVNPPGPSYNTQPFTSPTAGDSYNASNPTPTSIDSSSSSSGNDSNANPAQCTGCVFQVYNPITTFYDENDPLNQWSSVIVTETIQTQYITFWYQGTIDGYSTTEVTLNQTKTVVESGTNIITHTTPQITFEPTPGVYLTLDAGPTYVFYSSFVAGLDQLAETTYTAMDKTIQQCAPSTSSLQDWEPTNTVDWSYFIQTYTDTPQNQISGVPYPVPSQIVDYLKQDPDVVSQFSGSDIATCTLRGGRSIGKTSVMSTVPYYPTGTRTEGPPGPPPPPDATHPVFTSEPGTYISTEYQTTSTHISRNGCLRCDNTDNPPQPTPPDNQQKPPANPPPNNQPPNDQPPNNQPPNNQPPNNQPPNNQPPNNQPQNNQNPPSLPEVIASIINNNPQIWPRPTAGPSVTIGTEVLPINTAQPNDQNVAPVVIGTETFLPGQTRTINGVPVVLPSDGGTTRLIVDGNTITIAPAATGAPVLIIGGNTITANPQGQFVVGPQTLTPGGPAITIDGTTYSLGPNGNYVVVNGVTSTLANAVPITALPVLTIDGKQYTAIVKDGTTAYILGPGTTLLPGQAVTVSGTTYSLDEQGTALVINGQTSTISRVPASNSATTTRSSTSASTTSSRDAGDLIASGIGESSKAGAGSPVHNGGFDKWAESLLIGAAGWLLAVL